MKRIIRESNWGKVKMTKQPVQGLPSQPFYAYPGGKPEKIKIGDVVQLRDGDKVKIEAIGRKNGQGHHMFGTTYKGRKYPLAAVKNPEVGIFFSLQDNTDMRYIKDFFGKKNVKESKLRKLIREIINEERIKTKKNG